MGKSKWRPRDLHSVKWSGSRRAMLEYMVAVQKAENGPKVPQKQKGGKPPALPPKPKPEQTYAEYLAGKQWKNRRKQKCQSVGWRCEKCKASGPLNVHHLHYNSLGREKNRDLMVLCRKCHIDAHPEKYIPTDLDSELDARLARES